MESKILFIFNKFAKIYLSAVCNRVKRTVFHNRFSSKATKCCDRIKRKSHLRRSLDDFSLSYSIFVLSQQRFY